MNLAENKPPILHILVIGFHHKLGCQVEFSYPPLIDGTSGKNECPSGWKYLPTLALPDGSHNFLEDTVYFNLPSLTEPSESVYGISCYRQIPLEQLKVRTADMTRSTVQKSVCALTRLPIYGYIEVKLSLIADTFFERGDFSCTDLLTEAYEQLNAVLLADESQRPLRHFCVGLSVRDVMLQWRQKTLILFKLYLLQRRVIFFGSPVRGMCSLILCLASLVPRLLERGFQEVACVRTSRPMSPMPDFTDSLQREAAEYKADKQTIAMTLHEDDVEAVKVETDDFSQTSYASSSSSSSTNTNTFTDDSKSDANKKTKTNENSEADGDITINNDAKDGERNSANISRDSSVDTLTTNLHALSCINPDEYRAPMPIFVSGNLCLPYLSLPYMDLLTDPSVLSYIIGTSNVLFQQKRQLADVHIDIENSFIEVHDHDLRRQLMLSTEDLRFMDYLLRHVHSPNEDAEGSENWLREQFQGYLLAMLRTSVLSDTASKDVDHFNAQFMQSFKRTQCFQEWYDVRPSDEFFETLPVGHPFAGTLSVADMKLKIAQTMQNSESGRKINQAVNNTSRAVGGAITQAKGALTNWWSSITTPSMQQAVSTPNSHQIEDSLPIEKEILAVVDNTQDQEVGSGGIVEIAHVAESLDINKEQISANLTNNESTGRHGDIFVA